MKPLPRRAAFTIAIVLTASLLSLATACGGGGLGSSPPSLNDMVSRFEEKRSDFESLRKMLEFDAASTGVTGIGKDFISTETRADWPRPSEYWGMSRQRWNEYKKLFDEIGMQEGVSRKTDPAYIEFYVWTQGIVDAGTSRGIAYSTTPLKSWTDSEDDFRVQPIGNGWYAFGENGWPGAKN